MAFDLNDWEVLDDGAPKTIPVSLGSDTSDWEIVEEAPKEIQPTPNPQLSTAEALTGGTINALQGFGLGFGDEAIGTAVGAGSYLANKAKNLVGGGRDLSLGEAIDERTQAARELRDLVKEQNPKLAATAEIAGAVANPLSVLRLAKVGNAVKTLPKLAGLTAEGAAQGAIYGAGTADAGDRLKGAKEGGLTGALVGGGLGSIGTAISKIPGLARKSADKIYADMLGVTGGDLTKSARYKGLSKTAEGAETKLTSAARELFESGTFKGAKGAEGRAVANQQALEKLDDDLFQTLNKVDELRGAQTFYPKLKNAEELVEKAGFKERPALREELAKTKELLKAELDGSISSMQKAKVGLNSAYLDSGKVSSKLDAAVRKDLRESIEAAAQAVSGKSELGKSVSQLNSKLGKHLEVQKILDREVARDASKTFSKQALQAIRTSGGVGVPLLGGALVGNPALGALVGGGLLALRSDAGKRLTASALGKVAKSSLSKANKLSSPSTSSLLPFLAKGDNTPIEQPAIDWRAALVSPAYAAQNREEDNSGSENALFNKLAAGGLDAYESYLKKGEEPSSDIEKLADALMQGEDRGQWVPEKNDEPTNEGQDMATDINKLVKALIQTESAGNPKAVSPVGAKGLGQLMDPTGKEWAEKLNVKYDPFDPEQNLKITELELSRLMDKYGDERLALAAYNWGQGNLDKLIKRKGTRDFNELEKFLPKETQGHNKKTLKNLALLA